MKKNKCIIGLLVLLLLAVIAFAGCRQGTEDPTEPTQTPAVILKLSESEYDVYCVLTEGAIRFGADGESYEMDVWSLDQNKGMTLTIDTDGIIPRDGRVYRVFVPKAGGAALFDVPVISGGMQKWDFTRTVIAHRDSQWLYNGGMTQKFKITEDAPIYYMEVVDDRLRRADVDTAQSLAQFNGECSMEEDHAHTNGCYRYNAFIDYSGGFLDPYELEWLAISVDGSGIYYYVGTLEDSLYACLPGEDSNLSRVVFTTTEVQKDGTIGVKDLTGKEYTCKVSDAGIQPVGGRSYHIDEGEKNTTVFSVPDRTSDGYDFKSYPVTDKDEDTVEISVGKQWNLTADTTILTARRFWTGWMYLEEVDGDVSDITLSERTASCDHDKNDPEHTNDCFYYGGYYKTDGSKDLQWVMTEENGKSLWGAMGTEDNLSWGSVDPENTVLVLSVSNGKLSVMDMNGKKKTCAYTAAEDLPVYAGALYHVEWDDGAAHITQAETNYNNPQFDVVRQPLTGINGDTLTFSAGSDKKVAYLNDDTEIFYMAMGDNRLIPMSSGSLQIAHRTGSCMSKGAHTCNGNCFYNNTVFGCDGQGNIKWLIMSAYNGSLFSSVGSKDNLKTGYASSSRMCLSLTAMDANGKVTVLQMDGTEKAYTVDTNGLIPERGRLYGCTISGDKIFLETPNNSVKNCAKGGIVIVDGNLVTMNMRETFRITSNTRIYNVEVVNNKLYLTDGEELALSNPTNSCKEKGTGHSHDWGNCYNSNAVYATDGAGNLLWMIVRPDGNSLSDFFGNKKGENPCAGDPAKVLFTTSHIDMRDDGTMWIKGITMDGKEVSYQLADESMKPVKGSIYHMELVEGKAILSVPNADHSTVGYDLGARPLAELDENTISLATGQRYNLTGDTLIYNVEIIGSDLVLTDTKELTEATRNCTQDHVHSNDCYTYNMFFAADANDNLLWVINGDADTAFFGRKGMDAELAYAADESANVVVSITHTYPDWENGIKVSKVKIMDLTDGTEKTVTVDASGLLPTYGKGYCMTLQGDGTAKFSLASPVEVPGSNGYDFARYQILDISADGKTLQLRNGRLLKITEETQIINARVDTSNRLYDICADGTVLASLVKGGCTGADHNHTYECLTYSMWYASDDQGNIRWILSETAADGIYNVAATSETPDVEPLSEDTGFVFVTAADYETKTASYFDVSGEVYTNVSVNFLGDGTDCWPQVGSFYKVSVTDGKTSFTPKTDTDNLYRDKVVSYGDGIITGDSDRTYRVSANTHICYVDKQGSKVLLTEGTGIPVSGNYNMICQKLGSFAQWIVVEIDGESVYNQYGEIVKATTAADKIVLTTSDPYPEWENGIRYVKIQAMDMTGANKELTVVGENIPVKGRLYVVADGSFTEAKNGTDMINTRTAAMDGNDWTVRLDAQDKTRTVTADTFQYKVSRNGDATKGYTLALVEEGNYGVAAENLNQLLGMDAVGNITWVLSVPTTSTLSYYVKEPVVIPAPPVAELTGDTGLVFVTAADYETKTASYFDICGNVYTDVTVDFTNDGVKCWPQVGFFYKAVVTDGKVAFTPKTDADRLSRDKAIAYNDGVLTGDSDRSYKITNNTHICYVDINNGVVTKATGTGIPLGPNGYNIILQGYSGGYANWVIVEIDGQSIYNQYGSYFTVNTGEETVLTTSHPYPVWDADGNKTIQVKLMDMTGAEQVYTVSSENTETVVPGKLYKLLKQADGTAVLTSCLEEVGRTRVLAYDETAKTVTVKDGAGTRDITVSDSAWTWTVTRDSNQRMTLTAQGIAVTASDSFNAIYGLDGNKNIAWILTESAGNSVWYGTYGAGTKENAASYDAPAVTQQTGDTGFVFVTAADYAAKTASFFDVLGTEYTNIPVDFSNDGTKCWPKVGCFYKAAITNGTVAFIAKQDADRLSRDKALSYADGVLTGDSSRYYKITDNTLICYVDINSGTVTKTTGTGIPLGPNGYNVILQGYSGSYANWIIVEVDGQSIYNQYGSYFPVTTAAANVVLTQSDPYPVWTDGVKSVQVKVTDMTGAARTLTVKGTDYPVKGRMYVISGDSSGYTFADPEKGKDLVNTRSSSITGSSASDWKWTLQMDGKEHTFAADAWTANVQRSEVTSGKYAISLLEQTYVAKTDTSNFTQLIGMDDKGNISWVLSTTNGNTLSFAVDPDREPAPAITAPTFETAPYVLVTKVETTAEGTQATMTDLLGVEHTCPVSSSTPYQPKANLPYVVTVTNGEASFERVSELNAMRIASSGYDGAGTITSKGKQYKITADTKIFYVTRTSGQPILTQTDAVPADGLRIRGDGAFNWITAMPDSNGYISWMIVEVTNQSIYSFVDGKDSGDTGGDDWFA